MTNEESRQLTKRLVELNWKRWHRFTENQRETVKNLMRVGYDLHSAISLVDLAWYIDNEPVVRCRDCRYFVPAGSIRFDDGSVNADCCGLFRGYRVQITPDGLCVWDELIKWSDNNAGE